MERAQLDDEEIGLMIPFHDHHQFALTTDHLGLIDFMDEPNFDHFIDLIRGGDNIETEPYSLNYLGDFDQHNVVGGSGGGGGACNNNNYVDDHHLFTSAPPVELFDFNFLTSHVKNNIIHDHLGLQVNACENEAEEEEEIMDGEEYSSATTTTRKMKNSSSKGDRSRTLVSERRRRGRMKEKLYALRALVPNITKMDKASIVGDAVLYVQNLQMQAKKLKSEIAALESPFTGGDKNNGRTSSTSLDHVAKKMINVTSLYPIITKKIFKMDVFEVEERGVYVRIVSNKEKGVAVFLYRALESSFDVRTSNLAAASSDHEKYVFTFTLHMMEGMELHSENVKLWIASIFLDQGFQFETS